MLDSLMPARSGRFLLLLVLFVVAGCRPRATQAPFDPSAPELTAARLRAHLEKHPEDQEAWRDLAHVYWLHLGRVDDASPILERLADGGDPTATLDRLIMSHARLDPAELQTRAYALIEAATKVAPEHGQRAFLQAAAEVAAPLLAQSLGELEGDEQRFVQFYDTLALRTLPFSVQQPLISARAAIARRDGENWRPFFQAEGCVQDWSASAVLGTLGVLELERQHDASFSVDPQADVVALSCVMRVWNPTRRSGIRRLRSWLDVPGDTLQIDLSAEEAIRVYLDGQLLYRTDRTDRYSARRRRLDLQVTPGVHELEVATFVPGEKSWILVRATDENGRPIPASANAPQRLAEPFRGKVQLRTPVWPAPLGALDSEIDAPLRHYLAVHAALADGDSDRAEQRLRALSSTQRFPEAHLLRARFEQADPTRPRTISAARERSALERGLELDSGLDGARLRLLEILLDRGDDTEALAMLERLPDDALRTVDGELLRYRAHGFRGNEHLAVQALERAAAIHPRSCQVLMAKRSEARDVEDVAREDALTEELAKCGGSLKLRARLAETRDRMDEAEALWAQAVERVPDDTEALEGLARVSAVRGRREAAEGYLQQVLSLNPYRLGARLGLADLAAAAGDAGSAQAQLGAALELLPHSDGLRQSIEVFGIDDDLDAFRVDGREALDDYLASGVKYEGVSEVLVLDRSVARVYDGGGQRHIVHLVVHLSSKEALDRYGEVDVPSGARLLTLHSIKPDGRVLEPEVVPGKDGVELRHLEVGDFVEYEFVIEQSPTDAIPGYVDVSTFRFQSLDIPYHRSELIVVAPQSMPLKIDRRNDPPEPEISVLDVDGRKLERWHFRADRVPRLGVEPGHRPLLEEVPNVRVYTELDVQQWAQNLGGNIRFAQRTNPELRRHVGKLLEGKHSERDKLETLWTWVVENVEEAGDLSMSATATFAARTGSRLMLLRAMLEVAGIDSQLWLARDAHGPAPVPGGHPMIESFDAAMLAVHPDGSSDPLVVMAVSKVMPLGYLPPGYSGSTAYRVPLEAKETGRVVQVPKRPPEHEDRRHWVLDVDLDAKGSGRVSGRIELRGMEAVIWRQALRDVDRDRVEEVFLQAELGWLAGAELMSLQIRNERDLGRPLIFGFEARADDIGIIQDGTLVLRSNPLPLNTASRFTALPRRVTGLVIPYAPRQEAQITYALKPGQFVDLPRDARIRSEFGTFTRKVEATGGKVTLRYHSELRPGVVEPQVYPDLAEFAREIETATQAPVRAQGQVSTAP